MFNHCSQNRKQHFLSLLSGQFVLLVQVHNCLLIWSLNALKFMVVYALSKNTVVFFLVYITLICGVWQPSAGPPQPCAQLWSWWRLFLPFADLCCTECIVFLHCTLSLFRCTCAKAFLQNVLFLLCFMPWLFSPMKGKPVTLVPLPLSPIFFYLPPDVFLVLAARSVSGKLCGEQKFSFVFSQKGCNI